MRLSSGQRRKTTTRWRSKLWLQVCYLYTKTTCCKALRGRKTFRTKFCSRMHQRRYNKPLLGPVRFWDALGTLKSSAAKRGLYPHSSALYHPSTSHTVFPSWKHKAQGWGCTAAFGATQNLGEEPTNRSKSLPLTWVGNCVALHHRDHCLCASPLKYGIGD